jgi:hypothetical protein
MLSFKTSLASAILTFILFAGGIGMENAYGQSDSPFANCIMIYDKTLQVLLSTDEDCNEPQFSEAVAYYKANGFPHEGSYNDLFGTKSMQLLTDYGNSLSNELTK